jgi:hypothetical protein
VVNVSFDTYSPILTRVCVATTGHGHVLFYLAAGLVACLACCSLSRSRSLHSRIESVQCNLWFLLYGARSQVYSQISILIVAFSLPMLKLDASLSLYLSRRAQYKNSRGYTSCFAPELRGRSASVSHRPGPFLCSGRQTQVGTEYRHNNRHNRKEEPTQNRMAQVYMKSLSFGMKSIVLRKMQISSPKV